MDINALLKGEIEPPNAAVGHLVEKLRKQNGELDAVGGAIREMEQKLPALHQQQLILLGRCQQLTELIEAEHEDASEPQQEDEPKPQDNPKEPD